MPPDPILAVLCLAGLFIYVIVGAVVATLSIRWLGTTRGIANVKSGDFTNDDTAMAFTFGTILWPGWLVLVVLGGIACGLVVGPAWIARRVGMYVAGAVDESS